MNEPDFGPRLREWRLNRSETLLDVAERGGLSRPELSKLERNVRYPGGATFFQRIVTGYALDPFLLLLWMGVEIPDFDPNAIHSELLAQFGDVTEKELRFLVGMLKILRDLDRLGDPTHREE